MTELTARQKMVALLEEIKVDQAEATRNLLSYINSDEFKAIEKRFEGYQQKVVPASTLDSSITNFMNAVANVRLVFTNEANKVG